MKKIGFVDYYISEWHANNYPKWIAEQSDEYEIAYVWAEIDTSPVDGRTTDEWCNEYGAEKCETLEQLCEKSDYIIVLAPSNPEVHLRYAETVLRYGKNTYIDKTFAPDFESAKKIFDIAEEHGTKLFSTSALRYADELTPYAGVTKSCYTEGGGRDIEEYIIHQIEMVVKLMGTGVKEVDVCENDGAYTTTVTYRDGRVALMRFSSDLDFFVRVITNEDENVSQSIDSPFFKKLISEILRFLESGETPFDPEETLEVMRIREAIITSKNTGKSVAMQGG